MKKKKNTRRIFAFIAIGILLSMYLLNLILALIGSPLAQNLLKASMVLSIMVPILLYAMAVLMKKSDSLNPSIKGRPKEEENYTEEDSSEKDI
ncbi:MAG: hypothetical protein PUB22_06595 [Clostridiales bacterium]|nr:hypothetical protein [Clostridiales bacterium]